MQVLQFFVIPVYLLQTATNKKNTHKIKTKTDKANHRRKLLYLFDSGHDLGYPVKHADARKGQRNTIDDLNNRFVFKHRIFWVVVQFLEFMMLAQYHIFMWRIRGFKGSRGRVFLDWILMILATLFSIYHLLFSIWFIFFQQKFNYT